MLNYVEVFGSLDSGKASRV